MNRVIYALKLAVVLLLSTAVNAQSDERPMRSAVLKAVEAEQDGKPSSAAGTDWPSWRGPEGNGIAPESELAPLKWNSVDNMVWRTPVPGRGHSSPAVVGDAVYLTTADEAGQVQSALAFDRRDGQLRWKKEISRGGFPERVHPKNTNATPTIACDGTRLFLVFFHHESLQATALDTNGGQLWQVTLGSFKPKRYEYGYAASPVIFHDLVIFTGEYDGDAFIAGLERLTGKERWRIKRPSNVSYSTPAIAMVAGREQMFISGADQITSYDPATGKQLWVAKGCATATCGTMVSDGDLVFASGGFPQSETIAVRADGSGEVVWTNRVKCYEQSMLAHDGYLYALADSGVMYCWKTSDGREMWKQRLKGPISASPVLVRGHIYWANELGTMYVVKANPEKFELVAENQLGDESFASPAVSGGRLFLRVAERIDGKRQEWLYSIGDRQR